MLGSAVPMTRSLRCIVPLVAVLMLASCGGESSQKPDPVQRASASSDVNALLKTTFANVGKMHSATVDLKLQIEAYLQETVQVWPSLK